MASLIPWYSDDVAKELVRVASMMDPAEAAGLMRRFFLSGKQNFNALLYVFSKCRLVNVQYDRRFDINIVSLYFNDNDSWIISEEYFDDYDWIFSLIGRFCRCLQLSASALPPQKLWEGFQGNCVLEDFQIDFEHNGRNADANPNEESIRLYLKKLLCETNSFTLKKIEFRNISNELIYLQIMNYVLISISEHNGETDKCFTKAIDQIHFHFLCDEKDIHFESMHYRLNVYSVSLEFASTVFMSKAKQIMVEALAAFPNLHVLKAVLNVDDFGMDAVNQLFDSLPENVTIHLVLRYTLNSEDSAEELLPPAQKWDIPFYISSVRICTWEKVYKPIEPVYNVM